MHKGSLNVTNLKEPASGLKMIKSSFFEQPEPCRIWFYWGLDPLAYAQKGLAVNEFRAPRWQSVYASGDITIGDAILQQRGLPRNGYNRALGFCVLVFAWIVYNLCTWLVYSTLDGENLSQSRKLKSADTVTSMCKVKEVNNQTFWYCFNKS